MSKPQFLVYDGQDNELTSLEKNINQPEPEDLTTHNHVIYFKPRNQSPTFIEQVIDNQWKIKLCLMEEYPGLCIKSDKRLYFEFVRHQAEICDFCDFNLDFRTMSSPSGPEETSKRVTSSLELLNDSFQSGHPSEVQTDSPAG